MISQHSACNIVIMVLLHQHEFHHHCLYPGHQWWNMTRVEGEGRHARKGLCCVSGCLGRPNTQLSLHRDGSLFGHRQRVVTKSQVHLQMAYRSASREVGSEKWMMVLLSGTLYRTASSVTLSGSCANPSCIVTRSLSRQPRLNTHILRKASNWDDIVMGR